MRVLFYILVLENYVILINLKSLYSSQVLILAYQQYHLLGALNNENLKLRILKALISLQFFVAIRS